MKLKDITEWPKRWSTPLENIVHGLGGLLAVVVVFLGFRGIQVNAYLALLFLALIFGALTHWLWRLEVNLPLKIIGTLVISVGCTVAWFMTEPPPPDRWIRSPFKLSNAVINTISPGGVCPAWCQDEIVLDDAGILFPIEPGRGYVVIGFTDTPTLVLKDPKPGKVPLPKSPRPRSGNAPSISIDWFEVPPGVKGVLKIRKPHRYSASK
jgi:hypothetical protein